MSNPATTPKPARRTSRQREAGEATRKETRRRVLVAAGEEFAERGYTGATVNRIAERADVAVPTLYSAWGSKRALLRAVMAKAVTSDEAGFDDAPDRRQTLRDFNAVADPADPRRYLHHLCHGYRLIAERSAVGWKTYRDAAAIDPDIADDWQQLQLSRRDTFTTALHKLPTRNLRPGLTRQHAIDTTWAIASPDTHELFVVRRGWTYDQYEEWVRDTLTAALLPD